MILAQNTNRPDHKLQTNFYRMFIRSFKVKPDEIFSLGLGVLKDFNALRPDQSKNIIAWTSVVAEILEGFSRFDDHTVSMSATLNFWC